MVAAVPVGMRIHDLAKMNIEGGSHDQIKYLASDFHRRRCRAHGRKLHTWHNPVRLRGVIGGTHRHGRQGGRSCRRQRDDLVALPGADAAGDRGVQEADRDRRRWGSGHLDFRRPAAGDGGSTLALAPIRLHPHRLQHDPVAGLRRLPRAARRLHEKGRLQDRGRGRLRQFHDVQGAHLRHSYRRQRAYPLSAQRFGRGCGQQEAVRRQARQGAEVPRDLGG